MVVLVEGPDGVLVACRPGLGQRVRACLLAARSDEQLATGVPPERDLCLALRAERLVSVRTRRLLARSLDRLLEQARHPPRGTVCPMTPRCRRRLIEAGDVVSEVIGALTREAPISSRGVAALCVLLRDGSGPLYAPGTAAELRERLDRVRGELLAERIWGP